VKSNKFIELISNLKSENGLLKFVIIILTAALIIEGLLMVKLYASERTIIVPAYVDKRFSISNGVASQEYIEMMTKYAIELLSNYTPETVSDRQAEFMKFIPSDYYKTVYEQMAPMVAEVKANFITQHYIPQSITLQSNKVVVIGVMRRYVQDKLAAAGQLQYEITFRINNGRYEIVNYEKSDK